MIFIFKPAIVCIVTIILIIILKSFSAEYVPLITLLCGAMILVYSTPYISSVLSYMNYISNKLPTIYPIIKITLKIILIALICEFVSQLCIDCGQSYISSKINFIGKITILSTILPFIVQFVDKIMNLFVKL